MSKYPGMVRNRGVRSATVTTVANPTTGAPGSMTSSALQTSARSIATAKDVQDPERLVKVLNDLQAAVDAGTQATRSNPFSAPSVVRGVTFGPGQVVVVPHQPNRPFTDWHPARTQGAVPALLEVPTGSTLYPPQLTASQAVVLQDTRGSGATATVTIVVVGD